MLSLGQAWQQITRLAFHVSSMRSYHNRPRDPKTSGGWNTMGLPIYDTLLADWAKRREATKHVPPAGLATLARVRDALVKL
jgi:hypothetical protein